MKQGLSNMRVNWGEGAPGAAEEGLGSVPSSSCGRLRFWDSSPTGVTMVEDGMACADGGLDCLAGCAACFAAGGAWLGGATAAAGAVLSGVVLLGGVVLPSRPVSASSTAAFSGCLSPAHQWNLDTWSPACLKIAPLRSFIAYGKMVQELCSWGGVVVQAG